MAPMQPDGVDPLARAKQRLARVDPTSVRGRIVAMTGLILRAKLPHVRAGALVRISREGGDPLLAEIVGFDAEEALLMPLGDTAGIGPQSLVETSTTPLSVKCGPELLGRVLDGLGRPMDGGEPLTDKLSLQALDRAAPHPLQRPRITEQLGLGIKAIDGLLTIGQGQRVGLFAGSGVGKSTLLGQIARQSEADICVVCLVGERGREVQEFITDSLGEGLERSVVVCATSDTPPLVQLKSAYVATAVAEYFRDQGHRVLLLMDSVTRFARALREVRLAAGEPPARRGFPPSVFAELPRLLERTGTAPLGSITALYTVLVEGGDMEEPVADEVRGILDGHIVLSRELAERGHWPAIDVLRSLSRLMNKITQGPQQDVAAQLRRVLAVYEQQRDLITLGAYKRGTDRETDWAIDHHDAVSRFLQQRPDETVLPAQCLESLMALGLGSA